MGHAIMDQWDMAEWMAAAQRAKSWDEGTICFLGNGLCVRYTPGLAREVGRLGRVSERDGAISKETRPSDTLMSCQRLIVVVASVGYASSPDARTAQQLDCRNEKGPVILETPCHARDIMVSNQVHNRDRVVSSRIVSCGDRHWGLLAVALASMRPWRPGCT